MSKEENNVVIDDRGYVPEHILKKMKKKKEEKQKQIGKVKKAR